MSEFNENQNQLKRHTVFQNSRKMFIYDPTLDPRYGSQTNCKMQGEPAKY